MSQTMSQAAAQLISSLDSLNLSASDLKQVRTTIDMRIMGAEAREMNEARDKIRAIASSVGLPLSEILGTKALAATRAPAAAKYRNPENDKETRSGRGARPKWIGAALASGKTIDQLAIKS